MKNLSFFSRKVSFDAHNLVLVPKQRRRLSAFIRVCAVFVGMFFACLQFANAQPFARHHWLNPMGENYTLSPPTSRGEWIIAAPRNERLTSGAFAARKNTIAVFRLDNAYNIVPSSACPEEVSVIGMDAGGVFNPDADFVVNCIVESCNPDEAYVLCGSVSMSPSDPHVGMVAVLDAQLNLVDMRRYPNVRVLNSIYAQDGYYYAGGQENNGVGIVLRDNIAAATSSFWSVSVFETTIPWDFHKIAVRENSCSQAYAEIAVSGTDGGNMGWASFLIIGSMGMFTHNHDMMFAPPFGINSKVPIAYYPPVAASQDLLLSASSGAEIHGYVINTVPSYAISRAFSIHWDGELEDMDCSGDKVAWVGKAYGSPIPIPVPFPVAEYIRTDITINPPADIISFFPPQNTSGYYHLHKVHYSARDNEFHAGGYFEGFDTQNNPNRTTFAVTPEPFQQTNCNFLRQEHNINPFPDPPILHLPLTSTNIQGNLFQGLTKKFGFCTMDCDGNKTDDCGNQELGNPILNKN